MLILSLATPRRFLSHPPRTLTSMSLFNRKRNEAVGTAIDPFADPVNYLAGLGIEAELVAVVTVLPEAA